MGGVGPTVVVKEGTGGVVGIVLNYWERALGGAYGGELGWS